MDITLQEVANIVDETRGRNYFSNQLEKALAPLFKKLKSIESSKETIKVSDLFKLDDQRASKLADDYESVLKKFIKAKEDKVDELKKTNILGLASGKQKPINNIPKIPNRQPLSLSSTPPPLPKKKFDLEETEDKVVSVRLESINDSVIKKLGVTGASSSAVLINSKTSSNDGEDEGSGKKGGILGKIFKYITTGGLGLLALTAGAFMLYKGFKSDGKFKGTMKIIGKKLVSLGIGMVQDLFKWVGTALEEFTDPKVIKRVYKRMRKLNISKSLARKLTSLMAKAGTGAKIVFKKIPFLGAIISFAFAYSRFQKGDILGGLLEITSGLLSLVPVVGTALAFIPDIFLAWRDFTTTSSERKKQSGDMFAPLVNWIKNLKFVKALTNTLTGLGLIFGGNTPEDVDRGFELLKGRTGVMGIFPWLGMLVDTVGWFAEGGLTRTVSNVASTLTNWGTAFFTMISDAFSNAWDTLSNIHSKIMNSNTVQDVLGSIQKSFWAVIDRIKEFFTNMLDTLNPKKMVEKSGNWLGESTYKLIHGDTEPTVTWSANRKPADSTKLFKQLVDKNKEKQKMDDNTSERRAKMTEENSDRRHNELMSAVIESGQANAQASTATTQAIISTGRDKGGSEGTTNIFSNGSSDNSNRLRDAVFVDVYATG